MSEDDDIPVLTQILRTGAPRDPHVEPAPAPDGPSAARPAAQDFDVRPLDLTAMVDPLVIGNEPQGDARAFEDDDEAHDPARYAVTDEKQDAGADPYREPQDHDRAVGAGPGSHERRVNPFVVDEPRERRQVGEISLQRLASITSSVRDSVLVALQTRIDTELDARIAQAMHREVETAIAHLQDRLRDGLTDALRDVVARAVDDEMTRFVAAERDAASRLDPRKPPARFDA